MEKKSKTKAAVVGIFAFGIAVSLIFAMLPTDNRQWTVLGSQIVDDPTLGTNSGICGFYVFVANSTYTANLTSGTGGYVSGGSAINATNIDFMHTVMQDLIVWARINNTDCGLDVQFTRCNITWAGNITGTTAPDQTHVTGTSGSFIFVNYVWEDYTCTRNQKNIPIDDIIITGYK